jgi:hypothetical protein
LILDDGDGDVFYDRRVVGDFVWVAFLFFFFPNIRKLIYLNFNLFLFETKKK